MSVSDPCIRTFHARQTSGTRSLEVIKWAVIHTAEAFNARNIAIDFSRTTREASAHFVIGSTSCYRCLRDDEIPEAAIGANLQGIHFETAASASWSRAEWLKHDAILNRLAFKVAKICHKYQLGTTILTPDDLRLGRKGITTHAVVNKWQINIGAPGDHSHTDPGSGFPMDVLHTKVSRYHVLIKSGKL